LAAFLLPIFSEVNDMVLNHMLYQQLKVGESALQKNRKVKVVYIYPGRQKERDDKIIKELANYFAKKIQQSSIR